MTWNNKITAKKVVQNRQEFLLGTFEIRQVRQFTKFTEHIIVNYEEVEEEDRVFDNESQVKPIYNPEIQRKVNNSKVERIADFLISDPNAMFPTNIVIAIPNQVIESIDEQETSEVCIILNNIVNEEIKKENGAVFLTIIDGQHRIRGIERAIQRVEDEIKSLSKVLNSSSNENLGLNNKLKEKQQLLERLLSFELLVTFFIDPTLEYQAMVFATINKTQTKVPENLVYSLFGLTKDDSPQKTSLEVVLALNGIEKSPFFNRVKLVGGKYKKGEIIPLSQATMVKSILKLISNNLREAETDRFKKREELKSNPRGLAFRKYYANHEDRRIVRILYSFYSAVKDCFTDEQGKSLWELSDSGRVENVLQTNVGYQALLKVLLYLLPNIQEEDRDKKLVYIKLLEKANGLDFIDSGQDKRYPYTSSSINVLYNDIIQKIS